MKHDPESHQLSLPQPFEIYPADQQPPDLEEPTLYLPAPGTSNGIGIILFPGGGYGMLSMEKEGHRPARWLAGMGFTALVAPYRVAPHGYPAPLLDGRRALRVLRSQAAQLGIDPQKIGVMGYSAGGHLAGMLSTLYEMPVDGELDDLDDISLRPDFSVLCYPVVDLETNHAAHRGSAINLLGQDASTEVLRKFSIHHHVNAQTPPAFLWHTSEDDAVPPQNSLWYYDALHNAGVPAEMHIYRAGPHGMDMGEATLRPWTSALANWLLEDLPHLL